MVFKKEESMDDWVDVKELPTRSGSNNRAKEKKSLPSLEEDLKLHQHLDKAANERLATNTSHLFLADLNRPRLYDDYIAALPADMQQYYNCNACRAFVRRYGALALVRDDGSLTPLLWSVEQLPFDNSAAPGIVALACQFEGASVREHLKITSAIREKMKSSASLGGFHHMYLDIPASRVQDDNGLPALARTSTSDLAKMLDRVLSDNSLATVQRVVQILESDKLPHAHQHVSAARWLLNLQEKDKLGLHGKASSTARHNLKYRYAAESFVGCINQLRNGVLSTLLEGVREDKSWDEIEHGWNSKTDPILYMRPQAAPKAGNIDNSEKLFHQLGITQDDLRRRYLVHADVPGDVLIWKGPSPRPPKSSTQKLFAHIVPRSSSDRKSTPDLPPTRITFTNFINKVMPTAQRIQYKLATESNSIYFFITGHPNTTPLMQWHYSNHANRASWYIYHHPQRVKNHELIPNEWNDVTAIMPFPHLWDGVPVTTTFPLIDNEKDKPETEQKLKFYHSKNGFSYLLALENIIDKQTDSLCLFPTLLKGEFHGARATIEKFSGLGKKEHVKNVDEKGGYVGGIGISRDLGKRKKEGGDEHLLRVTDGKGQVGVWDIVMFE
jgi:hypothetical protein